MGMDNFNFGMGFGWLFPIIFIIIIFYLFSNTNYNKDNAIDILDKKYANGEITEEEYINKKNNLNN